MILASVQNNSGAKLPRWDNATPNVANTFTGNFTNTILPIEHTH